MKTTLILSLSRSLGRLSRNSDPDWLKYFLFLNQDIYFYLRSKTEKPPLISKPASKYGKLAPKGLKSKLLNRLQGNSRQYFDSGDYNGNGSARRPSAPKLVPGKYSN